MNEYPRQALVRAGLYLAGGLISALLTIGAIRSIKYHPIGGLWASIIFGAVSFSFFRERRRLLRQITTRDER